MRGTFKALVLSVVALASCATAPVYSQAPPVVTPEIRVEVIEVPSPAEWKELKGIAGKQIKLKASMPKDNKTVRWVLIDDTVAELSPAADNLTAVFSAPVDGRYRLLVVGDSLMTRVAIQVGKIPPTPNPVPPGPGPNPDPVPPTPIPGGVVKKFVIVEETSTAQTWRGALFSDPKIISFYQQFAGKQTDPVHKIIDISDVNSPDPVVKKFIGLAAGKELPWLWLCDATGAPLRDQACPKDVDAFIGAFNLHEEKRAMGLKEGKPKLKWKQFGSDAQTPVIPRNLWKPMTMKAFCPPVHDQDGIGQCASSAATGLLEFCRNQVGQPYVYLSAGDLYSRVNGGRDDGSLLEDNLSEIVNNGVATAKTIPYIWNRKRTDNTAPVKAERQLYMAFEIYQCSDFDQMASAIQLGFGVEHGLMWYDNFKVDGDGWLPSQGRGGAGGHARFAYGLAQRNGDWGLITQNSWGPTWGGSQDGTIKAGSSVDPESLFGTQIGGFFAVRAVKQQPVPGWTVTANPFERKLEAALNVPVLKP